MAITVNTNFLAILPRLSSNRATTFFQMPLVALLATAAVCLALGPGPPGSQAGSSGVSCTSVSSDNGASLNIPFNPGP
jgi:hypothetical protein